MSRYSPCRLITQRQPTGDSYSYPSGITSEVPFAPLVYESDSHPADDSTAAAASAARARFMGPPGARSLALHRPESRYPHSKLNARGLERLPPLAARVAREQELRGRGDEHEIAPAVAEVGSALGNGERADRESCGAGPRRLDFARERPGAGAPAQGRRRDDDVAPARGGEPRREDAERHEHETAAELDPVPVRRRPDDERQPGRERRHGQPRGPRPVARAHAHRAVAGVVEAEPARESHRPECPSGDGREPYFLSSRSSFFPCSTSQNFRAATFSKVCDAVFSPGQRISTFFAAVSAPRPKKKRGSLSLQNEAPWCSSSTCGRPSPR